MGVVSPTSLEEYRVLKDELLEHGRRYYRDDAPTISDAEYDQRFRALLDYEEAHPHAVEPDSPSQRVGSAPRSDLPQVILSTSPTANPLTWPRTFTRRRSLTPMHGFTRVLSSIIILSTTSQALAGMGLAR